MLHTGHQPSLVVWLLWRTDSAISIDTRRIFGKLDKVDAFEHCRLSSNPIDDGLDGLTRVHDASAYLGEALAHTMPHVLNGMYGLARLYTQPFVHIKHVPAAHRNPAASSLLFLDLLE